MGGLRIVLPVFLAATVLQGAENKLQGQASGNREQRLFVQDWRFIREALEGAEDPAFDDAAWRTVNLPHDWSIEGPFRGKDACDWRGGYVPLGTGWYRKTFEVPATLEGRRVSIEFDGIYKDSDVWINGQHLGSRWYGYSAFQYDLTPHLRWGARNVIAVRVRNPEQTCRWYTGSGIYRHVWLVAAGPLSVAHWATHVTTPEVSAPSNGMRSKDSSSTARPSCSRA